MQDNQSAVVDSAVTDVTAVGEGVINSGWVEGDVVIEPPPVTVWNENGVGGM